MYILKKLLHLLLILCLLFAANSDLIAVPKNTPAQMQKRVAKVRALAAAGRNKPASKASKLAIHTALKGFRADVFRSAQGKITLDKGGLKHILERHHPNFWNGTVKKEQSFLDRRMSVKEVRRIFLAEEKSNFGSEKDRTPARPS